MKNPSIIFCILFISAFILHGPSAQTATEEDIATDSVDIFSEPQAHAGRSATIAMVSSLLLPGSGHHYLERNRSALAYITAEAATLFGFFFCRHYSQKTAVDAAGYAWIHSGAQGVIKSADDYFWKQVGSYMDVKDYNNAIDLDRLAPETKQKFTREDQYWRWDSEESKDRFNSMLSASRTFHVISSFCIGALVLDRLIAFIDIRTFTLNSGTRHTGTPAGSIKIRPSISVSSSSIGLGFSAAF